MTFNHNFLPKIAGIERLDSPDGRKYKTPDGNLYESVTTWLGRSEDKAYLEEWRKRIGDREADKITKRAAKRGTALHENVESFLLNNKPDYSKMSMLDKSLFVPFSEVLLGRVDNVMALEYPLYSDTLRLAGTIDMLGVFDGKLSIIDFKTSKNRKSKTDIDNYFIQATIYSLMIEELYGIKVTKLVILIAIDYENKVQVFEANRKTYINKLCARLKEFPTKRFNHG